MSRPLARYVPPLLRGFLRADAYQAPSSSDRVARFVRRHALLLALLGADIASKLAAFHLLPEGRPVTVLPGLRMYLAVNEWGVMGGVQGIGAVTANPAYTILLAAGLLLFALVVVQLGASSLSFLSRVGAGAGVFLLVAFAAQALAVPLAHLDMPADWIVATIRVAVLAVSLAFYAASKAPLPRVAFTLLAAGALSNAASYVYPPFEVVDFLMIPLQPITTLFARGEPVSSGADVGVINFADAYLFLFPLVLILWPAVAMARGTRSAALG